MATIIAHTAFGDLVFGEDIEHASLSSWYNKQAKKIQEEAEANYKKSVAEMQSTYNTKLSAQERKADLARRQQQTAAAAERAKQYNEAQAQKRIGNQYRIDSISALRSATSGMVDSINKQMAKMDMAGLAQTVSTGSNLTVKASLGTTVLFDWTFSG